jgi:hypothetical protein
MVCVGTVFITRVHCEIPSYTVHVYHPTCHICILRAIVDFMFILGSQAAPSHDFHKEQFHKSDGAGELLPQIHGRL